MNSIFCFMAFFLSMGALNAQDYSALLREFEQENQILKRRWIVNDDYKCTEYFSNGEELPHRHRLRFGKVGRTKVLLKFKKTSWNGSKLIRLNRRTYGNEQILLRRRSRGHLMMKTDESILDCRFPERDDDWDWHL